MSKKRELKSREPFIHMSKSDHMPLWKSFGVRLIGLALSLCFQFLFTRVHKAAK